jgi:hypothetical protein
MCRRCCCPPSRCSAVAVPADHASSPAGGGGGALILLYGINTTRVLVLRRNQMRTKEGNTYLTLRDHDLVLPPKLAQLLAQLPRPTRRSTLPEPLTPTATVSRTNAGPPSRFGRVRQATQTVRPHDPRRQEHRTHRAGRRTARCRPGRSARHRYRHRNSLGGVCQRRLERLSSRTSRRRSAAVGGALAATALGQRGGF